MKYLTKAMGMAATAVLLLSGTNAFAQSQQVFPDPSAVSGLIDGDVMLNIQYDVSDGNSHLTGIGVRIHFNSSELTFVTLQNLLPQDLLAHDTVPQDDTANYDNDPNTDKYLGFAWTSFSGSWPGSLPIKLFDAKFHIRNTVTQGTVSQVNFSSSSTAAGYTFAPTSGLIEATNCAVLDVDCNQDVTALTDGLLIIRHMFGFTGAALISGAVGPGCSRCTAAEIDAYLDGLY